MEEKKDTMAKLVYIASAGHSGSTLLDIVVGSIPKVFSTGEVVYLPWQIGRPRESEPSLDKEDICTCLKSFEKCDVWSRVIEKLNGKVGYNIYKDPFRFRMAFINRQKYPPSDFITRVKRYLYSECIKHSYMNYISRCFELLNRQVTKNNWLLFDTLGEVCNADYIVDSSKDYLRLKLLSLARPQDIYLIILMRSPYGVAYSEQKLGRDPIRIIENWVKLYNKTKLMIENSKIQNYTLVRYEKLCEDPVAERKRIADFLKLPDPGNELNLNTRNYHIIAGNPMRYRGEISVRFDEKWKQALSEEQIEKIRTITAKTDPQMFFNED